MPFLDIGDRLATPRGRIDLAREFIGIMFHPKEADAQKRRGVAFAMTVLGMRDWREDDPELVEQAKTLFKKAGLFKTASEADPYFKQQEKAAEQLTGIIAVGALMQILWAMDRHHRAELPGGSSLNKAVAVYVEFPYFAPMKPRTLWSCWDRYKNVAHFCAAYTSVFEEARREEPAHMDERMKRGFHEDLHETLGAAAAYQHFGTAFAPRGVATPLIDPTTAWLLRGIEPDLEFLPTPLPANLLAEAQRYKAPQNSAYR